MDGHDDGSAGLAQPVCWFCGEPELLEIFDIWVDGHFQLDTCCQGLVDSVATGMNDDPAWGRELLRRLGAEEITGRRLRRVSDGDGGPPMLDYKLQVRPVSFRDAVRFVRAHHTHAGPPTTWRFGASLFNGWVMLALYTGVTRFSRNSALIRRSSMRPCCMLALTMTVPTSGTGRGGKG